MEPIRPTLNYSRKHAPRELTLEDDAQSVRVIFPVAPVWVYWVPVITGIVIGCVKLAAAIILMWELLGFVGGPGTTSAQTAGAAHRFANWVLFFGVGSAVIWWSVAAHSWWMYRRWGRVPVVLSASSDGLVFSSLRWWRIRDRVWPVAQIKSIELRPVKGNLNWKRTVADLYIHRVNARRLHFRLSSPRKDLPARIAERLSRVLDRPSKPLCP